MNILIPTLGSYGDMHPFLGIARELKARGHHVTVIAPAIYESLTTSLNLGFEPIGTVEEFERLAGNPDIFIPRRALAAVAQAAGQLIEPYYRAITKYHVPDRTVLVYSSLIFAARIAQEKFSIPSAVAHLSPALMRSSIDPPYAPWMPISANFPIWWNQFLWRTADLLVVDRLMAGPINRFRASLGLSRVRGIYRDWIHSPDLVIDLFPPWFAPPAPDWPKQTVLTGFPLYDESDVTPTDDRLLRFLDSGSAPIAFTPGSAMRHGQRFFGVAIEVCRHLGKRGLLLSRHSEHIPKNLPPEILHIPFAPFSQLLPRCAALVHHGGIGTCAQALASGVPQLVTPMTHDQPDNARRLQKLGVAEILPFGKLSANRAAASLSRLLNSPQVSAACTAVRAKFQNDQPILRTADLIEQLAPKPAGVIIGSR
jgi:rhamnosyltransferase subunit B